jgi:hypothetical protein
MKISIELSSLSIDDEAISTIHLVPAPAHLGPCTVLFRGIGRSCSYRRQTVGFLAFPPSGEGSYW